MINELERELNELIDTFSSGTYAMSEAEFRANMDWYKTAVKSYFSRIAEEKKRIMATKGRLTNARLVEGVEYRIEDLENDIVREGLIKDPKGCIINIVPRYYGKGKYTSYIFKKTTYETAILMRRERHN